MNITNRTTHDVQQGTEAWLSLREGFNTASEAPAALGVSKFMTRSELMRLKHTGVAKAHDPNTLAKFRDGHAAEAKARPMVEVILDAELFPTTMTCDANGIRLLASMDGLTLDDSIAWETKLWNEELAADVRAGTLSAHYTVQMDQELLVSGASRCLFTCTDGTPERFVWCWYEADQAKFDALLNGWAQFEADLADYVLPESAEPSPVGKAPETLPALLIEVTGKVTASNLAEFKETALAAIRSVNRELTTDAHFADAERAVKWCSEVEERLAAAKQHALSQTDSIDALFRAIDDISAEARAVRLDLNKLVTRRKTEIREEAVSRARTALAAHVTALNAELAPASLPLQPADFAGAVKGLRSFGSMQEALDTTLANGKIAADAAARGIRANLATFRERGTEHRFLFADLGQLLHKAPDDFVLVLQSRIDAHKVAEDEKARKAQEAEAASQAASAVATAAATAPVQQAAPAVAAPVQAPAHTVAPAAAPRADEPATLRLGAICDRLGFTMTQAFIADTLGIKPAKVEGASKLYREGDFARICAALQRHIAKLCGPGREEVL